MLNKIGKYVFFAAFIGEFVMLIISFNFFLFFKALFLCFSCLCLYFFFDMLVGADEEDEKDRKDKEE